jgi:hypothetical protein
MKKYYVKLVIEYFKLPKTKYDWGENMLKNTLRAVKDRKSQNFGSKGLSFSLNGKIWQIGPHNTLKSGWTIISQSNS